ncbi:MAG: TonB family protein [Elusimicrobia bacterium]|nr:TonB family protein [Elusimicrobiota bacterium]MBP9127769.1 TonB family protein [Elusimicrobiota bacterium]MBP9699537.1 TonB family protein [Elusimicrobiota bacterium]
MAIFRETPPFRLGLELSILIHSALFLTLSHAPQGVLDFSPQWARRDPLEVDLTRPFRLTSDPRKAFRSSNPGTGAPRVDKPTPEPFKAGGGVAAKGVDWTLPTPGTKIFETPTDIGNPLAKSTAPSTGTGTAEGESRGLGGLGTGGDGEVDWIYLTEIPRLLNRDELVNNVLRFYPKAERLAGREGRVVAQVHLNRDGAVSGVDIESSAGLLFDEAAKNVLSLARFSPARAGDRPVAVKFSYPIDFHLTQE